MIGKLQKKFISITAAALFAIILLVTAAISGLFFYQTNRMLDERLDQIVAWQSGSGSKPYLPGRADKPRPLEQSIDAGARPLFENRLDIRPDGCLIILGEDGSIREICQQGTGIYSAEELSGIAADILAEKKTSGWHQYYKFRRETDSAGQTVIGLLNASASLYSVFTVVLISAVIGLSCFLLVLLIVALASRRAVAPVAESYIRQKQFVTDAGHELKTPLTVISANNELLRMLHGDNEWSQGIDRQVAKMNGLIRDLITLAKMDEEQPPIFASFNLSDAVYDTAKSFENLIHAQGRIVTFDIAEDILYTGDEARLRQLVSILMDNAAKYCDEMGKIAVHLRADKQIRLQILNDYASAGDYDWEKVFQRFYRMDRARTPDGSYGLGLSIASSIVELHRGYIHAKTPDPHHVLFEVILR